jgi:hypothetical protein
MIVIPLSSEFVPLVSSGRKTSTIRSGVRKYPLGPAVMQSKDKEIPIRVERVRHLRFCELAEEDALRDGLLSLDALRSTLRDFYPSMMAEDMVTVVEFSRV